MGGKPRDKPSYPGSRAERPVAIDDGSGEIRTQDERRREIRESGLQTPGPYGEVERIHCRCLHPDPDPTGSRFRLSDLRDREHGGIAELPLLDGSHDPLRSVVDAANIGSSYLLKQ
ncbi:hypothetical protein Ato02nite_047910 [Paractinoplanes toevensis]|uniref:Uncharacterized protein n=1 Tax=Paractinoplanes toevensis TaxID=571911 RepID=A0A919TCN4_9ACTN|nr:hypothetical protein Ato02nite_047910 [Actinoplanes toevensis]